jgi:hypothetical protein
LTIGVLLRKTHLLFSAFLLYYIGYFENLFYALYVNSNKDNKNGKTKDFGCDCCVCCGSARGTFRDEGDGAVAVTRAR